MSLDRLKELTTLLDSKVLKKKIFDRTYDGVMLCGEDGRVWYCNESMSKLTGYSQDELIGDTFFKLVPKRAREQHVAYLTEGKGCACTRASLIHKVGYIVDIVLSAAPVVGLVEHSKMFVILVRKVL